MRIDRAFAPVAIWATFASSLAVGAPVSADDILRQNPQIRNLAGVPQMLKVAAVENCPAGRTPDISRSLCVTAYESSQPSQGNRGSAQAFIFILYPKSPKVWLVFQTQTNPQRPAILLGEFDPNGNFVRAKQGLATSAQPQLVAEQPPRTGETALPRPPTTAATTDQRIIVSPRPKPAPERNIDASMMRAAFAGNLALLQRLISQGANVNAYNVNRGTALNMFPDEEGKQFTKAPALEILLLHGADPNFRVGNDRGDTPLHIQCVDPKRTEVLLKYGADPNLQSMDIPPRDTPLHRCVREGPKAIPVIEALLRYGASLRAKNGANETACTIAQQQADKQMENYLRSMGGC